MDVAVPHKRVQRRLRPARLSVLGDGLLERARSTSLALLGISAAVGLGMVALALNQGWPPVAASRIPDPPVSAIHDRVAVAKPPPPAGEPSPPASAGPEKQLPSPEVVDDPPVAPSPRSTEGGAVAPAPVGGDRSSPKRPADRGEKPAAQPPPSPPAPAPAPAPTPVAVPDPAPAESPPEPEPEPEPAFPEAVASSHPGQGHAYGKGRGNGPPEGVPPGHAGK